MTLKSKIFATCRMYLKALEENDEERKQVFIKRANMLCVETLGTEYEFSFIRESILFRVAGGESGYYLMEDLRKAIKVLSGI